MPQSDRRACAAGELRRAIGIEVKPGGPPPLSLRPLEAGDRGAFLEMLERSRASVERWTPLNRDGEPDGAYFDRQLRLTEEGDRSRASCRRVGVLGDGTLAGVFCLNNVSRGLSWEADAIWWVDEDLRGNGIATSGVRQLLAHAFADLPGGMGLHGVHCGIESGNDASVRVAERCGFVHVPGKRSHLKVGDRWALHEFYLATHDSAALPDDAG